MWYVHHFVKASGFTALIHTQTFLAWNSDMNFLRTNSSDFENAIFWDAKVVLLAGGLIFKYKLN